MRHLLLMVLSAAVLLGQQGYARREYEKPGDQPRISPAEGLAGAWRLVSIETLRSNGEVIYPFYGKHPEGLLIYDPSGWMSVQIVSDPKPLVPKTDSREVFLASTPTEKAAAADGFYAYFGTWTVDAANSTVTHQIEQSFYPGERGESGVRRMSISGKLLTLVARAHEMGEDHERKLVWERIPQAQPPASARSLH